MFMYYVIYLCLYGFTIFEIYGSTVADDDVIDQCDYIVLGYVRVPLLQLITKNNGVDGDFTIFDEFK